MANERLTGFLGGAYYIESIRYVDAGQESQK
jgi:hypothetical protein